MGSLSDLLIMLAAGVFIVPVAQYLKLGSVSGFLIAGILVGPSFAGLIAQPEEIHHISQFGVVFLLFVIGMEVNPQKLWHMRSWVFGMGLLQVLISATVLSLIAIYVFSINVNSGILIGACLSLSSTAFVMQILFEKKAFHLHFGRASFAILLLQDLAVVPLLALIGFLAMGTISFNGQALFAVGQALGLLFAVIFAGRFLLQPLLNIVARAHNTEIFTATALLLVIGMALLTESIGLSMEMGAFIAGLLIADSNYRHQIMAEIHPFRGILLGLFFMSMGLSVNLGVLFEQPLLILALTALLMLAKFSLLLPILKLFKLTTKQGIASALLLAQSGEFALVIFSQALEKNLLSLELYQQLLLIVLCSMLATPLLAHWAFKVIGKEDVPNNNLEFESPQSKIILAGYGRVGQRIASILEKLDVPYVAIDKRPEVVDMARKQGREVFYGDARKHDIFKSLHMSDDSIVIITLDDFSAAENLVVMLSSHYPKAYILVRGHDAKQCKILLALGAADIVSENLEASIQLSRLALIESGVEAAHYDDVLSQYKFQYYNDIS